MVLLFIKNIFKSMLNAFTNEEFYYTFLELCKEMPLMHQMQLADCYVSPQCMVPLMVAGRDALSVTSCISIAQQTCLNTTMSC